MVILLGITLELATVIGSIILPINATTDALLDIANKGYKINKKTYDETQKKLDEEKKEITTPKRVLNVALLLIPGVNLIRAGRNYLKIKKSILNDVELEKIAIPMTDEEKEKYANLEKKIEKLAYVGKMCLTDSYEELIDEEEKEPITGETITADVDNNVQANIMQSNEIVMPQATEETTMEEGPKLTMTMNTKKK